MPASLLSRLLVALQFACLGVLGLCLGLSVSVDVRWLEWLLRGPAAALGLWALAEMGWGQLRAVPEPAAGNLLRTGGPYSVVRNPMYASLLLGLWPSGAWGGSAVRSWLDTSGDAGMTHGSLLLPAAWGIYLALLLILRTKIAREERFLTDLHGDAWTAYCRRVPRLLPFARWFSRDNRAIPPRGM